MAAFAGPLEPGAQVGLQLPQAGMCAAEVASCDGRALILELLDELAPGVLEEGSVLDLFMSLSWGMYKWLCIVSGQPSERRPRSSCSMRPCSSSAVSTRGLESASRPR
jgi:hypothetical protein